MKTRKLLIANGVNLDLLGQREPQIYGHTTLADIEKKVKDYAETVRTHYPFSPFTLTFLQTNNEEELLRAIHPKWEAIIINAGAWTHTSLALADRLKAIAKPYIEVHLSQIYQREPFRHQSYLAPAALGMITGLGVHSYTSALWSLLCYLEEQTA